ncbi:protein-glutamate O-methyltransferase CheR [Sedimentibacter sp. zth1]|uniref:CheR family methyltransferase n=1 Tax=Sedimentibacter sp. zth1 TaxID=2816908 RepID=UPI001A91CA3D|nr:protein-glutamate O-methyltransferase CheR [Sedimentibacter sp. zth1]QSX07169.1 protein-glutamate O-methyltransferase CheR [Sedimentibacter sp. zth1]
MITITDSEFIELVTFMKKNYGINLEKKRQLIEGRMCNLLEKKGMKSFGEYITVIKRNNVEEITTLINKLTTNHTFFYREDNHYKFLKEIVLPEQEKNNRTKILNIWSAGCSSGEEPFTTAMALDDYFGIKKAQWNTKILATDISQNVLNKAKKAIYQEDSIKGLPPTWKTKYLNKTEDGKYQIAVNIKKQVQFGVFNLMNPMPSIYKNKYHVIFCRNVMIYFDQKTKNDLINRFYEAIQPGGYLFIGHSETVQREKSKFKYICPAIYQKV